MQTSQQVEAHSIAANSSSNQSLAERLVAHPFFKGIDPKYVPLLIDCAMEVAFDSGKEIFRDGDLANRFYLIEEGEVQLETRDRDGNVAAVQTLGPGDVLGWSWLFPPYRWHFDARAVSPVKGVFFYGSRLLVHCESEPQFGYDVMKRVAAVLIHRLDATRSELLRVKYH